MKNNGIRSGIILVFMIITLVCIACEKQPDKQPDNGEKLNPVLWNGIEFNQERSVTDNQYKITVDKFKVVFNSDSFTDEERAKFKYHTNSVRVNYIGGGGGWFADSYDNKNFKLIISVPCDSIQSGIEKIIRSILDDIDKYFIDGEWQLYL